MILTKLLPYWDLAEGFLILVQGSEESQFIDEIYTLITKEISLIKDNQEKQAIFEKIQKLKITKEKQEKMTQRDQEEADTMLDDFINDIV